jgi:O-antigen/teichoic acid export membrane protein
MADSAADPVPQMLRNIALLLSGRGVAAVLGVLATIIMAKSLSVTEFGGVALIHALALLVRGLLNFKPFEVIVRYGADSQTSPAAFTHLLGFTRCMDHASAVAACLLTALVAALLSDRLGIAATDRGLAIGYALVLLASGTGSAKGILRLDGQFAVLGLAQAIAPALRLLVFGACALADAPSAGFLLGFGLGLLGEYLLLQWLGARAARARGQPLRAARFSPARLSREHPGVWRLLNAVYWQSNLDLIPKHAATVLAGGLLGAAAAGHLRLARELASVLTEPATLLRQALFPDLTRLATSPDRSAGALLGTALRFAVGATLIGAGMTAVFWWQGEAIVHLAADAGYLPAASLTVLLLAAASLMLAASVFRAAGYATDRSLSLLAVGTIAQIVYLGFFLSGSESFGLAAVGWGSIAAALVNVIGAAVILQRSDSGCTRA